MKRSTLIAAGMAAALAPVSAYAVMGMQVDFSGNGQIAGSTLVPGIEWKFGDVIIDDLVLNNEGTQTKTVGVYGQSWSPNLANGGYWSYQFIIDEAEATSTLGGAGAVITTPVNGEFKLFWNPAPFVVDGTDHRDGTCHGTLGGDPLCGGQVEIVAGEIFLSTIGSSGEMSLSQTNDTVNEIDQVPFLTNISNPAFNDVGSTSLSGSTGTGFIVDVKTQNRDYVVNDMVDTNIFLVDIILSVGLGAPWSVSNESLVTESVAGKVADFGVAENWDDVGDSIDGDASIDGPVNDVRCNFDGDDNGTPLDPDDDINYLCDIQFETTGAAGFNGQTVSEPAPLLLMGIGLGLMGFLSRRARKA